MMYSNDKNHKTPNVSQSSTHSSKHTFRQQFATGAGCGKKMQSVSCSAKYDPKGGETRILGQTVRMKIVSSFWF